jgi:hypothetical protein
MHHLARWRSTTRCKCFGSAKICYGADLVSDFRLHCPARPDNSRIHRVSFDNHVEIGRFNWPLRPNAAARPPNAAR